ncbi:MAG: prephenate dehydrogenase/arogenate dehydrogenase family protein [Thermoleophilia bacterium]|nr:prephenate dehydrogenase/arogenate dehydrogenase family protein [Thermoleophilia bacterium]
MGGSLGRALIAAGARDVRGVDPDPAVGADAVALGALTCVAPTIGEALAGARVAFVGAPIGVMGDVLADVLRAAPDDCVVSDLGSAKAGVVASVPVGERHRFVGGHPICGGERSGVAAGRGDMFRGATWFLTPTGEVRPELFQRLHAHVAAVGARPVAIDADVHDRLMALVSHVPHVLASALVDQGAATTPGGREALRSAGPSFADLTRVAGSNPPLWADIFLANRDALLDALRDYRGRLEDVERDLAAGDREALTGFVARAAEGRERLRRDWADHDGQPWRLVVSVPNRPGVLSEIVTALGHAHINIEDMALHQSSPEGGELLLTVVGGATAADAEGLVAALGYAVTRTPDPADGA